MTPTQWISTVATLMAILGGIVHVVWLLAQINTTLENLVEDVREAAHDVKKHATECDKDRASLNARIDHHTR